MLTSLLTMPLLVNTMDYRHGYNPGFRYRGHGSIANKPHTHDRATTRRLRQAERIAENRAKHLPKFHYCTSIAAISRMGNRVRPTALTAISTRASKILLRSGSCP